MENKKRVVILVAIALVLAITAITLSSMESEIPTSSEQSLPSPTGAVIGVDIIPAQVEDKMQEGTLG